MLLVDICRSPSPLTWATWLQLAPAQPYFKNGRFRWPRRYHLLQQPVRMWYQSRGPNISSAGGVTFIEGYSKTGHLRLSGLKSAKYYQKDRTHVFICFSEACPSHCLVQTAHGEPRSLARDSPPPSVVLAFYYILLMTPSCCPGHLKTLNPPQNCVLYKGSTLPEPMEDLLVNYKIQQGEETCSRSCSESAEASLSQDSCEYILFILSACYYC